ncbi:hypothetical protein BGZ73_006204 [Actinomortierella ambigua]|nr:hypothetical protein BGZ73_006204 [Actinomortierella ambigua]
MRFKATRVLVFTLLAACATAQILGQDLLPGGQQNGPQDPGPGPDPQQQNPSPTHTTANPNPTSEPIHTSTSSAIVLPTNVPNPATTTIASSVGPEPSRPSKPTGGPGRTTTLSSGTSVTMSASPTNSAPPKETGGSSSTDTLRTVAIVVGAVIIAAAIGIWVFRKWKLSPSRDFQSKIRGDDYQDYPRPYENDTMHLRNLGDQTTPESAAKSPYVGGGAEPDQYYDANYAKDHHAGAGGSSAQYAAHDGYDQNYGRQGGGYDQGGYGHDQGGYGHHDGYYDNYNQGGYAASQVGGYAPSQVGGYSQGGAGGGGGYGNAGGYGYDNQYGAR